ncbi:MAG: hypothetical protein ACTHQE_13290, partial [Thermomicrobiales bacterium]
ARHDDGITLRASGAAAELALDLPPGVAVVQDDGILVATEVEQTRVRIDPGAQDTEVRLRWTRH